MSRAARSTLTRWVGVTAAALLLPATCVGGASTALPVQTRPSARARVAGSRASLRVAVIVMENHDYGDIIRSRSAPFITRLAKANGLATGMYAVTHPSLPNYLALSAGSTFGIDSDCTGCAVRATSLVDQLEAARLSWKAYIEGIPRPCFTAAFHGDYAKKHDPFAYYTRVTHNRLRCRRIVPLANLARDERARKLARFSWVSPNLCHSMHDCSVATGDRFLARLVPALMSALGPHGLIFLTWDEGSSDDGCCRLASGGHVATIVAGPAAGKGAVLRTPTDHYSVLQTIEDLFGLPRLRRAACVCTTSLQPLLQP